MNRSRKLEGEGEKEREKKVRTQKAVLRLAECLNFG